MKKEDTTSPTVPIQGLIFFFVIGAKEDGDVATANIPGAFLHTDDTSGSTHLNFHGMMAELLARIDTDLYINYITTYNKGCKIMYA